MQKTAYEVRISDWSSDVCSSDLLGPVHAAPAQVVDVLDQHDAVVHHHAPQHQDADEGHDVALGPGQPEQPVHAEHREQHAAHDRRREIGRASCRERGCQYVLISGVAISLKKNNTSTTIYN